MNLLSEITAKVKELPTLPIAVVRLSAAVRDEKTTTGDIETIIRPDAALTSNLLRIANSAYFVGRNPVQTIRQTVTRLGFWRLSDLAMSAGFQRVIPQRLPAYQIDATGFWLHNVAVAMLSERLAGKSEGSKPDLVFTAGLLHDIGKLVIATFMIDRPNTFSGKLAENEEMTLLGVEQAVLGTNHCEVGEHVAKSWKLAEGVAVVARWHHQPDDLPQDSAEHQELVDLVHCADSLAHMLSLGPDVGDLRRDASPGALARLGLHARTLESVACDAMDAIIEMGSSFSGKN